MGLLDKDHQR